MFWLFVVSLVALSLLLAFKAYESYSHDLRVFSETRKQLDRWLVEKNQRLSDQARNGLMSFWLQCSEVLTRARRSAASGLRSLASWVDLS